MSAETDTRTGPDFGRVSRTAGIVFRYLLLAATLVGIVALGILLVYVAMDAFQPFTADVEWHLTYFGVAALPTFFAGAYLYWRDQPGLGVAFEFLGLGVISLLFSGGIAALFIDIVPSLVWLGYLVALAIPIALSIGLTRVDHVVPFWARLVGVGVIGILSLIGIPGYYHSVPEMVVKLPFVPMDWVIMAVTLGGPAAAIVGFLFAGRRGRNAGLLVGVVALAGVFVVSFAGPFAGIDRVPAAVIAAVALVPTASHGAWTLLERQRERAGLIVPVLLLAGIVAATVIVDVAGFAGPNTWLTWEFLTGLGSGIGNPRGAGIYPAIIGTMMLMIVVTVITFPVGVGAAIYLEEYASESRFKRVIDVNISNLAGVPSVVYGLLGLGAFVRYGGLTPGTVIVGGATLTLLILPIVIISSREAIRSVPDSQRQASYGMGATRWQTVRKVVLPRAFPGILTGTILALSRAIGETAPLIVIGAPQIFDLPTALSDRVGALPLQLYVWATTFADQAFYTTVLAAGVVVLLVIMLAMNSVAIVLRNRYQTKGES
jgi:phosphate transport system permease protein